MKAVQQQPNISFDKTTGLICEECTNDTFIDVMFLRAVSRFMAGTSKDAIMPIPSFACSKCGHVNDQFNPNKQNLEVE